jgi:hypothetical protein
MSWVYKKMLSTDLAQRHIMRALYSSEETNTAVAAATAAAAAAATTKVLLV